MKFSRLLWLRKSILELRWFQEVLVFAPLLILFILNETKNPTKWDELWRSCCYFLMLYAHAQIHRFAVLPQLLDKRNPLAYAVSGISLLLIFSAIVQFVCTHWLYPDCQMGMYSFVYYIGTCAMGLIAILTPFLVLRFYRQQKQQDNSQLCMKELELSQLRSQLNPHFLFNTFNNLYGISLQEPARVPDLILQTSKLMRYQLESHIKPWVSLEDELMFIESYIALEEERVGNRCEVSYETYYDSPGVKYQIAPMMLMPFVENAFKHGADCMSACFVDIRTCLKDNRFEMHITNSVPAKSERRAESTGIGLENVRQQLDILYPGKKHSLKIESDSKEYKVILILQLKIKEEEEEDDGKI